MFSRYESKVAFSELPREYGAGSVTLKREVLHPIFHGASYIPVDPTRYRHDAVTTEP